ncbi:hypothetical protein GHT06_022238 [Daphnia sinensis]|uniref:Uncharacterized protein n=1 Tax=Daphnia sinensis TaxID=1820382 RepID=A0AAD5KGT5_9CRUS|nr:hypothetical protein GHT06_022238 [Daphnia sinensis]
MLMKCQKCFARVILKLTRLIGPLVRALLVGAHICFPLSRQKKKEKIQSITAVQCRDRKWLVKGACDDNKSDRV